jgi:hypothetical protein
MLRIGVRIEKSHAGLIRERRPVRFSSGKVGYAHRWIKPDSTRGSASEDSIDQMGLFDTSQRESWEMTVSELEDSLRDANPREKQRIKKMINGHRGAVAAAISAGKPVPQKVVDSYPSLGTMHQPFKFGIAGKEPVAEFEHNGVEFKALGRRIPNIGGDERQVILYRETDGKDTPLGIFMVPEYERSPDPAWVVKKLLSEKGSAASAVKSDMQGSGAPRLPEVIRSDIGKSFNALSLENRGTVRLLVQYAYDEGLDTAERMARINRHDRIDRKLAELFRHATKPGTPLNTVFFGVGEPRDENGASVFELPEKVLAMAIRQKWDEGGEPLETYLDRVDRMIRKRVLGES